MLLDAETSLDDWPVFSGRDLLRAAQVFACLTQAERVSLTHVRLALPFFSAIHSGLGLRLRRLFPDYDPWEERASGLDSLLRAAARLTPAPRDDAVRALSRRSCMQKAASLISADTVLNRELHLRAVWSAVAEQVNARLAELDSLQEGQALKSKKRRCVD